jgi:sulfite oxidase
MKPTDKHPALMIKQAEPFNAGPPLNLLRQSFVTPQEIFFVRNHGNIPEIDPTRHRLSVNGLVSQPLELSLDELKANFSRSTVTAALECAGNRRTELLPFGPIPEELPWGAEAIGNAVWTGTPLREVLLAAGAKAGAWHAAFESLDRVEKEGRAFSFGGSIPIEKALSPEVLLAYAMNGEPLTPVHGYPLRVMVPGYIGARSVKWLQRITLQAESSENYFQTHAYKLFPPHVRPETVNWAEGEMLGEVSINSVICEPKEGDTLPAGRVSVRGYALAGTNQWLDCVELSADGGKIWTAAQLEKRRTWAWRFWESELELGPGPHELVVRAWDAAGNTQPAEASPIWNFKGYMNNAWHQVNVRCVNQSF